MNRSLVNGSYDPTTLTFSGSIFTPAYYRMINKLLKISKTKTPSSVISEFEFTKYLYCSVRQGQEYEYVPREGSYISDDIPKFDYVPLEGDEIPEGDKGCGNLHTCSCEKLGLAHHNVVTNKYTGKIAIIGSSCIMKFFPALIQEMKKSKKLRSTINKLKEKKMTIGKYKGVSYGELAWKSSYVKFLKEIKTKKLPYLDVIKIHDYSVS